MGLASQPDWQIDRMSNISDPPHVLARVTPLLPRFIQEKLCLSYARYVVIIILALYAMEGWKSKSEVFN